MSESVQSRSILVIGAHSADFVWRAAGAIAVITSTGGKATVVALSYGERGESGELWKEPDQTVEMRAITVDQVQDGVALIATGLFLMVPQDLALYDELSARANLRFFGALYSLSGAALDKAIKDALDLVGLADRVNDRVSTYSGGMKRRLNLAAGLLHDPDVLLLDEPTVGVDPVLRQEFWAYFRTLASSGTTLLVSSHVMDEASRCDRLGLIRAGAVLAEGTANELVARAGTRDLESAFLALAEAR